MGTTHACAHGEEHQEGEVNPVEKKHQYKNGIDCIQKLKDMNQYSKKLFPPQISSYYALERDDVLDTVESPNTAKFLQGSVHHFRFHYHFLLS